MFVDPLQARLLFQIALKQRFALLAVNADSPAAITDVLEAARECRAPVIIEASLWQLRGRSFGAGDATLGMTRYLVELAALAGSHRYRDIPVLFHTDHIKGPETLPLLKAAIGGLETGIGGFRLSPSTVSLDSSELTPEQNIGSISELCRQSLSCGRPVTLEMEAGVDDGVTSDAVARNLLTPVERQFPGFVHLWAPGVGTRHGLGDQDTFSPTAVARHHRLASEIAGRPVGIALHGSSGLSSEALRSAVLAGVCKVNWSSESLWIRSQAARDFFLEHSAALVKGHPDWKSTAMDHGFQAFVAARYQPAVAERIRLLGAEGRAEEFRIALTKGCAETGTAAC